MRLYTGSFDLTNPSRRPWCLLCETNCRGVEDTDAMRHVLASYPNTRAIYDAMCRALTPEHLIGTSMLTDEGGHGHIGLLFVRKEPLDRKKTGFCSTDLDNAAESLLKNPQCPPNVYLPWGFGCGMGFDWFDTVWRLNCMDAGSRLICIRPPDRAHETAPDKLFQPVTRT